MTDYYLYEDEGDGTVTVYKFDTWPDGVMEGRERRSYIGRMPLDEALSEYIGIEEGYYKPSVDPGPFPPSDFDPLYAGEVWDDPY